MIRDLFLGEDSLTYFILFFNDYNRTQANDHLYFPFMYVLQKYMASKTQGPAKPENMLILKRKFAEVEMKSLKKTKGIKFHNNNTIFDIEIILKFFKLPNYKA